MTYEKTDKLHIVAVVAVIRNKEGRYLVLKRSEREIAYPGVYAFPGGKVENNETMEEALEKEVAEEAGLRVISRKMLLKDKSFIRPDGQTVKVFSYLCDIDDHSNVIISEDFTDYKWIKPEELSEIEHVGIEEELKKAEEVYKNKLDIDILSTKSEKV